MALGETCCFYAKHSGVIKETLTKVKENLFTREEEKKNEVPTAMNHFPTGSPS